MEPSRMYIGVPLSLFAISMSFAYPYLFVRFSGRNTIQMMSGTIHGTHTFIVGMAFTHCIAHMLPFVNSLVLNADQLQPLSGAIPATGFLTVHFLRGVFRNVQRREISDDVGPRAATHSRAALQLSRKTYTSLLVTASVYSVVESLVSVVFVISMEGSQIDTSGEYYCSFFTNQLILAASLGVLVLKTCYSLLDMIKSDILLLAAMYAGLHVGSTLQGKHMVPSTYMFLAILGGLSSGVYLKLFIDDVLIPEMKHCTKRKLCHLGFGLGVCLAANYYASNRGI